MTNWLWRRWARAGIGVALAAGLAACAQTVAGAGPEGIEGLASAARSEGAPSAEARRMAARRVGERIHPRILARFGGAYDDPQLTAYVERIGARLIAANGLTGADEWRFTVLNSPMINAWSLPDGRIYVTRGMLALAVDEADVAVFLGHELSHVERRHGEQGAELRVWFNEFFDEARTEAARSGSDRAEVDRTVAQVSRVLGGVLRFSQEQELEADLDGIRYAAQAGYDPSGLEGMFERIFAYAALEERAAGAEAPSDAETRRRAVLSGYPTLPERLAAARRIAAETPRAAGGPSAGAARAAHLNAVDGLLMGGDALEGFVRGREFVHPEQGFRVTAPPGFRVTARPGQVIARAGERRLIVFDGRPAPGGDLEGYLRDEWYPRFREQFRAPGPLSGIEPVANPDYRAVTSRFAFATTRGMGEVRLIAFADGDRVFRLTSLRVDESGPDADVLEMARSLRRLGAEEAARNRPDRLRVLTAGAGDTVASLARRLPDPPSVQEERFRLLNGLAPGAQVSPGDRVKLIVRSE